MFLRLAVVCGTMRQAALRDGFEASDLPFLVDIVEADGLVGPMVSRIVNERLPLPRPN
jgi:hypothetical protein